MHHKPNFSTSLNIQLYVYRMKTFEALQMFSLIPSSSAKPDSFIIAHNRHLVTQAHIRPCYVTPELFSRRWHSHSSEQTHRLRSLWDCVCFACSSLNPASLSLMCHLTPSPIWERNQSLAWEAMMFSPQNFIFQATFLFTMIRLFWKAAQVETQSVPICTCRHCKGKRQGFVEVRD